MWEGEILVSEENVFSCPGESIAYFGVGSKGYFLYFCSALDILRIPVLNTIRWATTRVPSLPYTTPAPTEGGAPRRMESPHFR